MLRAGINKICCIVFHCVQVDMNCRENKKKMEVGGSQCTSIADGATLDTAVEERVCSPDNCWQTFPKPPSLSSVFSSHTQLMSQGLTRVRTQMLSSPSEALSTMSRGNRPCPHPSSICCELLWRPQLWQLCCSSSCWGTSGLGMSERPCCRYSITCCPVLRWELNCSPWKKCLKKCLFKVVFPSCGYQTVKFLP